MDEKPSINDRLSAFLEEPKEAPPQAAAEAPQVAEYEDAPDDAAQAQAAPEAATEATEDDSEAVEIGTLQDLAEHLQIDVADLYNIRLPVTGPDGRQEVSLGEWKDGYQEVAKVKKLESEVAQQRQQFEQERAQVQELLYRQSVEAQALIESAENALLQDFQRVDWNTLRMQNPAEWAAKQTEFQQRQQQVQSAKADAARRYMELQQRQQEETQGRMQEILARESQLLTERIPEWRDETKATTEKTKLREYLAQAGFAPDEISSIADSRAIAITRKAWLFDQMQAKAGVQKSKVIKIGKKVLKPGSRESVTPAAENVAALRKTLRKTGSHRDAAKLISQLL